MAARGIPRLFVGNLPWTIGRKELRDYFSQFGQIQAVNVYYDKETGVSRNFGFIQFGSREGYLNSARETNHFLEGNRLTVSDMNIAGSVLRTPNQKQNFRERPTNSSTGSGQTGAKRPSTNISQIFATSKGDPVV
ncbi:SRA stem-loop-interacting RNA-binding protein, mitochondrial-like isoform X2 [Paramacrobiotus metropolitanus]|nr:SRA stem-loop-interacting RNA-binding protein, mitochondrial-like isoform X2 [Paramacrobiotus metropolitanus]